MRRVVPGSLLALFTGALLLAQGGQSDISFEVAAVRRSAAAGIQGRKGGPGTSSPERFSANRTSLRLLLFIAYRASGDDFRVQIQGPDWIDTETYDVLAKVPKGSTKEQFQIMLQRLLVERFSLRAHREAKLLPVYELVVAKGGPKLKETGQFSDAAAEASRGFGVDDNGFPIIPPGEVGVRGLMSAQGGFHFTGRAVTMADVARMLTGPMVAGRPVLDKTGLAGRYDFTLFCGGAGPPVGVEEIGSAPSLGGALRNQLGLQLVSTKAPLDVLVVDYAAKVPSEN